MRAPLALVLTALCLPAQELLTGEFDIRNRFVVGDRGTVYRSIVNLGEGPRLFDGSVHYEGKDKIDLTAHNWGGDPDSEAKLEVRRDKMYELMLQYRTLAYFNNLPSYANPLLAQGALLSQRAIDLRRRQLDLDLRLQPRARITPFFGLLRTAGDGHGVTPFIGSGDEFAVPTAFQNGLTTVRGGAQFTTPQWTFTLEQGWTGYTDEQDLSSRLNDGNRQDGVVLSQLTERYRGAGSGLFSRGALQAQPFNQLAFTGQFVYSRPKLNVTHELSAQGAFRDPGTLQPYTNLVEGSLADASQPHSSGSWSTEFRPVAHWRVRHNWFSDTFQISGASPAATLLELAAPSARTRLNLRYDQSEEEIAGDIGRVLTVRAGHRYIRSNADLPPASLTFAGSPDNARIRRHTALAGASVQLPKGRGRIHAEYEASPGGETYFRTGLQDYRKLSVQGRYQLTNSLRLTVVEKTLTNTNVGANFTNQQTAVTVEWMPHQGRRATFVGTYSRETLRSTASLIDPTFFQTAISEYSDRGHYSSAFAELKILRGAVVRSGGSVSSSEGTRPTKYYAPQATFVAPATNRLSFVAEWRWYSYRSLEMFRTHAVSFGVQVRLRPT